MKMSSRISTIVGSGSDGWDLHRRSKAMIAAGTPVIELTVGEHDIGTAPEILGAMDAAARAGHIGYSAIPGIPALRAAVAARMTVTTGVATGPENIIITPGGQAALFMAHHAVCDEGDTALFIEPFYATYPGTIRAVGALPRSVVASAEDGFQPRTAALAAAAPGGRSLLVNSPNNPTGAVYGRKTLDAIAQVVADHDLWLISDEVYDSQVWDGAHLSPRALPGMAERTLVVGSLSKSHAMTGSRLGWVCAPPQVVARLCDLATHTTYGIPGFIQHAGLFALSLGPAFEAEIAAPFRRRRALTDQVLAGQNLIRAAPMQGAMYAMLDIRATGLGGEAFAMALLDAEHIAVMPGESFGAATAGHVRVAMTVADESYVAALQRLVAFAGRLAQGRAA